jgi:hypothetical protein
VSEVDIQIVSNQAGEPTAVIVPIALWKEIASERETPYLLKSETMRQRLRTAKVRVEDHPRRQEREYIEKMPYAPNAG